MTKHPEMTTTRVACARLVAPLARSLWICATLLGSGCTEDSKDDDQEQTSASGGAPAAEASTPRSGGADAAPAVSAGSGGAPAPSSASMSQPAAAGASALMFPIPAPPPSTGDAARGRNLMLNGGYTNCGIPRRLMGDPRLGAIFPAPMMMRSSEPPVPGREGPNATLPISMTASTTTDGAEIVSQNCMACHSGKFDGELMVGLPNILNDSTQPPSGGLPSGAEGDELLSSLDLTDAELASFKKMLRGLHAVQAGILPTRTVGQNSAWTSSAILVAHHDPATLEWRDQPEKPLEFLDDAGMPIPDARLASDPPPWWRTKKKHAVYTNGMGRGDHSGQLAIATLICVDSLAEGERVGQLFKDIQAYLETLSAPVYTRNIDQALAAAGKPLFEKTCSGCHGTYADDPMDDAKDTYPNMLVSLDLIGTDPAVASMSTHLSGFITGFNAMPQAKAGSLEPDAPFRGYVAPPLDGVWATAPYLHNGSVPTLALLLNSKARPPVWKRVDMDDRNFDEDAVGWPWEAPSSSQADAPTNEQKFIYDTSYWSQSNAGHTFGDALTDDERRAVIEYVKTL